MNIEPTKPLFVSRNTFFAFLSDYSEKNTDIFEGLSFERKPASWWGWGGKIYHPGVYYLPSEIPIRTRNLFQDTGKHHVRIYNISRNFYLKDNDNFHIGWLDWWYFNKNCLQPFSRVHLAYEIAMTITPESLDNFITQLKEKTNKDIEFCINQYNEEIYSNQDLRLGKETVRYSETLLTHSTECEKKRVFVGNLVQDSFLEISGELKDELRIEQKIGIVNYFSREKFKESVIIIEFPMGKWGTPSSLLRYYNNELIKNQSKLVGSKRG